MKKKLNQIAKDTNLFLKRYIRNQKKTDLIVPMKYGLFPGGKKIRSKILFDIGQLFNVDYQSLIKVGAAVECIHAYSLIHDDLPCMDNDSLRRGKKATHVKYGESTTVLAGNSLLTMAFEILSDKKFLLNEKVKVELIKKLSECAGHIGIAGGQYSDLDFENKKISKNKIIKMQVKKTGKLFSFCCIAPLIIKRKNKKDIKKFDELGSNIGLVFQIADDLIDYCGDAKKVGKRTRKDKKKGKATLISLLGYEKTIKYVNSIKLKLINKFENYGSKSKYINETINYILSRTK